MRTPYQNAKFQLEFGLIQRKNALKPFDINADPLVYDVLNYHGIEDKGNRNGLSATYNHLQYTKCIKIGNG